MPLGIRLAATLGLVSEVAPFAPASFGSLLLLPPLFFLVAAPLWVQAVVAAAVTWIGVWVSTRAEEYYGHDAGAIVIDEAAGMLVTFLGVAAPGPLPEKLLFLFAGFLLFRVMDIVKPFPANRAQNLPRGAGVMTDDLIAGLYANLALRLGMRLFTGG